MLGVGASNRIYECTTSAKGSMHDAKVFKTSGLYKLLTTHKWLPLKGALIVGNSAYPISWKTNQNRLSLKQEKLAIITVVAIQNPFKTTPTGHLKPLFLGI